VEKFITVSQASRSFLLGKEANTKAMLPFGGITLIITLSPRFFTNVQNDEYGVSVNPLCHSETWRRIFETKLVLQVLPTARYPRAVMLSVVETSGWGMCHRSYKPALLY
jgi:hypothetical protein